MADHASLTDPELHEPKGAASASSGSVYIADGAGSGSFASLPWGSLSGRQVFLTARIADISTAGQVYVVSPVAGTVSKIYSVINGAIATADVTLTSKLGGTAITDGAITVTQAGSAAGDVDSCTPTAQNSVAEGGAIEIETDGASTNTVEAFLTIVIDL